ncbi:hypothetical protein R77567_01625 [Ralstonia sp. LMG 32965]|uniref:Phage terminase large subunit family protein n=2 Tax=Ralstonia flatus TaxID=3058601 RepID=A0AAD2F561_9RALS|nr:phage terminase large subunit family protein [Ralstonia pickettii]CAJ0862184.1 hypothetical protein R77567_01625 [Ralstonia sp. LMG 32965]
MSHAIEGLIRFGLELFRPPKRMTLSEWADQYAVLSPESSADPGPWRTIPYQRGIQDAMTDPAIEMVTVMKSARVGYTKCVGNLVAYHIHQDPCPIMVVQPTVEDAEGYSKEEIAPMVRDTPALAGLVSDAKAKDSKNTILQKMFPGGTLSLVGANSPRGFRRVSRRIVIFDEVDGYPPKGAGNEGDQIKLGIRRAEYYWNRKIVAGSTPTTKKISRIENMFEKSDQRRFFVPCPHCGEMQYLKFGGKDKPYGIKWPEGRPQDAYYVCEVTGCHIDHQHKRWMVERGEWRPTAPGSGRHAGFHIWAAYSYSPNADWGTLAEEFLDAKDDPLKLQTFVNTVLGETWEESGDTVNAESLAARLEDYPRGAIPEGVAVLVGSADVQGDRIEAKIIGYGPGEESWLVDYEIFWGDPGNDPYVWEQLDEWRSRQRIHHATRQPMRLAFLGVDSSNGSHTDAIYDYVRPRQQQRVFSLKGRDHLSRPGLVMESSTKKGHVRLFLIATHMAKDRILSRMRNGRVGPGYMHMPLWAPEQYLEQMTSEKKIVKRTKQGTWLTQWHKTGRNEAFDLEVYCLAGLFILQTFISPQQFGDLGRLYRQVVSGEPSMPVGRTRGVRSPGISTGQ